MTMAISVKVCSHWPGKTAFNNHLGDNNDVKSIRKGSIILNISFLLRTGEPLYLELLPLQNV